MGYVFPAVFHLNEDGSHTITFPDLPGCISEGKDLDGAMYMAQKALEQWIEYLESVKQEIPPASDISDLIIDTDEFVNLIRAGVRDNCAVKRTVSIPKWMDIQASSAGLSLSKVLQDALSKRLQ